MLATQQFLRNGGSLEALKAQYAINHRIDERLGVVCLNYNQIESPMNEPIVQECRQLILYLDDFSVASASFKKFFNVAEQKSQEFDWSNFKTYEKLDGSLITFWHHKNYGWQVATRSVPDGSAPLEDTNQTFKDLVITTLKGMGASFEDLTQHFLPGYSYTAELMTPENQIVVRHHDRKLVLLAIRSSQTLKEYCVDGFAEDSPGFPLPVVQLYEGFSKEAVLASVQERNPTEHEGYVLVDSNFNRVKVKSDAYCLLSYQRDGLGKSSRARLEAVFSDKMDDILPMLPLLVQEKITSLHLGVVTLVSAINEVYEGIKHIESQKDFAAEALKYKFSAVLFALKSGRCTDPLEWLKSASVKSVLSWLNMNEEEISE